MALARAQLGEHGPHGGARTHEEAGGTAALQRPVSPDPRPSHGGQHRSCCLTTPECRRSRQTRARTERRRLAVRLLAWKLRSPCSAHPVAWGPSSHASSTRRKASSSTRG
ncbi:hypothetical protein ACFPRL_31470 [Pseudoclavibacter helvolus]